MKPLIGRKEEKKILEKALASDEAELIAVFGRRRVGKTFLIREFFNSKMILEFSGVHNATLKEQLGNFRNKIAEVMKQERLPEVPPGWTEAFGMLKKYSEPLLKKGKCVIFLDEFPWLNTPKSGFLSAFEYFWNSWGTKQDNLILIICGSAASWMIQKVVNNKGGLHNRITKKIRLLPFTLAETKEYLESRNVKLELYQIVQLYMVMGGIPHYLKEVEAGFSAAQSIDRLCFTKDGILKNEFDNLYQSLFAEADKHVAVVKALNNAPAGLTRKEIIAACSLSSGGRATLLLDELMESGFITNYIPYEKNVRDNIYKLSDEYSRFYLKYIENGRASGEGTWIKLSAQPTWKSWSGLAFESICLKHTKEIKVALGISGVYTEESIWRYVSEKDDEGTVTQIDLLLDRNDFCISICEMKFSTSEFSIDKTYSIELKNKLNIFQQKTKSRKTLFLVMVTTFGTKNNVYKPGLVQNDIILEDLFK
ncbi:ATP-binding protein [[Flexibacter] sp. ATCC 35208]|uniref:AAA family ATPase n=1 Tax=[Flexibacter] sp. ATCC 35208 TaxID=1936242 RepID=UPI0009C93BB2|nr:ATP-binding protein [[Flexibacter] sp. ATCC 35208]OMP75303.1 ATPase [[Flexibacter] sp. ATCC 35208]